MGVTTLSREQIETMEAGPEMDALVAERVMGCRTRRSLLSPSEYDCNCKDTRKHAQHLVHSTDCHSNSGLDCDWAELANYSEDIAAAWEVVKKAGLDLVQVDDGWMVGSFLGYTNHDGVVDGHLDDFAEAPTVELAICRAALLSTL